MVSVVLEVTQCVTNVTQPPVIPGVDLKNKEASVILTLDCNTPPPSSKKKKKKSLLFLSML